MTLVILQKLKHPKLLEGRQDRFVGYVPTNNVEEFQMYEKGREALVKSRREFAVQVLHVGGGAMALTFRLSNI